MYIQMCQDLRFYGLQTIFNNRLGSVKVPHGIYGLSGIENSHPNYPVEMNNSRFNCIILLSLTFILFFYHILL